MSDDLYADYLSDIANYSREMAFNKLVDTIDHRLSALEQSNPQPAQPAPVKKWVEVPHLVWRACKAVNGKWVVDLTQHEFLDIGDLWMPYIEGEPAPAAPGQDGE
ncbi:MAG: hypothetical protein GX413_13085 [Acetobacter sp.]|nr:hypothetical protein [Acetobacter sp.]